MSFNRQSPIANRQFYRPTWIEINRRLLEENFLKLRSYFNSSKTQILAVVKANAYGHGALAVAKFLEGLGATFFGVSSVDEGAQLREGGLNGNILILGSAYPFCESFEACEQYRLIPTISSLEAARQLKEFSSGKNQPQAVHIKIETGMQRIGARAETVRAVVEALRDIPQVVVEGVYTHFAASRDEEKTRAALQEFTRALDLLDKNGFKPKMIHAANSAAIVRYPETHFDLVRPGIALYGGMSGFEPIASLKSRVVFLKEVSPGTPISYEGLFVTKRKSRVATIPVGYADGLPIAASSGAEVIINGQRAKVCGLITMDMLMVDVTDLGPVRVGDVVTLLGKDGQELITPIDWAEWSKMSVYQFLTGLGGTRVPKTYTT